MGTIFLHLIQFLQFVSHSFKKGSFSLPVPCLLTLLTRIEYQYAIYYCKKYTSNKYYSLDDPIFVCR